MGIISSAFLISWIVVLADWTTIRMQSTRGERDIEEHITILVALFHLHYCSLHFMGTEHFCAVMYGPTPEMTLSF